MATFYATVTRILDELNRSDLTSQAGLAVRSAIEYYSNEAWGFNETATSYAVVTASYSYALPADFRAEVFVGIDYNARRYPLCTTSYIDWQSGFDTDYVGIPGRYTLWADKINLEPIPDRTLTLNIGYVHTLPELTDSASNGFTSELEELIRMRAEADLLNNTIRGTEAFQEALLKKAQEQDAYRSVRSRRTRYASTRIKRRGLL